MQRPPAILFTRATSEWINRVTQKHTQLIGLKLSESQTVNLARWVETEFVYSALKIEGEEIEREQVARLASSNSGGISAAEDDSRAVALIESLRALKSLARENGKAAELRADLLLRLHNVPGAASSFRKGDGGTAKRRLAPAEVLPAMIDNACQWYTAESFAELNPVEQASIVFLRLLELQPFDQANESTALLAASLFTLRSELPPIIIPDEKHVEYRDALEEGYRMNTKPMVELIAEVLERSLTKQIEMAGRMR